MVKRRVVTLGVCAIMSSMFLVGCANVNSDKAITDGSTNVVDDNVVEEPAKRPSKDELVELEKEKEEAIKDLEAKESNTTDVSIWIPNVEYISTGDESLDKLIKVEVQGIPEKDESNKYMRLLKTLNKSGDSPIQVIDFKSATLKGDTLEIDIADASDAGIGSTTTEFMIIEQIKATIFGNFEEVNSIQLKIDGKITEDFLGHIDISQAFTR